MEDQVNKYHAVKVLVNFDMEIASDHRAIENKSAPSLTASRRNKGRAASRDLDIASFRARTQSCSVVTCPRV
jgi:hypothetical protein